MYEAITDELYNSVKEITKFHEAINDELEARGCDSGLDCIEVTVMGKKLSINADAMAWEALEDFLIDLKKATISELEEWLNE